MDYLRQYGILNPDKLVYKIIIIGAGGIGNPMSLNVASMGFPDITVFDYDRIEEHNIPSQLFYGPHDTGRLKVEALAEHIKEFTGVSIKTKNEKFTGEQNLEGIVISAVDTLEDRRVIWDAVKSNRSFVCLYIDGRIGGRIMKVFTIRPSQIEDIEIYERSLKKEAAELPCSAQTIIYVPAIVSGIMADQLTKYINSEKFYRKITFNLVTNTYLTQYEI